MPKNHFREEKDLIGSKKIETDSYYGINTIRALENFPISNLKIDDDFIKAYGLVKLACAQTNKSLGAWEDEKKFVAIENACMQLAEGKLNKHILLDALQGGAGTSTNMNINEVIANKALELTGKEKGDYKYISPHDDINLHQSTNDTYPTALKLAAINKIKILEDKIVALQEAFQQKEKDFSHIVKIGRTQLQDAVLTTLGREMASYAECFTRDRWRIYKCEERLRVINLGGTAIGTGLGAPRQFIFQVTDKLRSLTGIGFARAENLVEATTNNDVFVEVSGILKAFASSLIKCATDFRLLASGPHAGFNEITLPGKQAGSSIMPGKVNPVIPEAVSQAAILMMSYDSAICMAVSMGNLELNQFMPLICHALLHGIDLLTQAAHLFRVHCVEGIKANEKQCKNTVENSTAAATALVPVLGYDKTSKIVKIALEKKLTIREILIAENIMSSSDFDELITPEAVSRLGSVKVIKKQ